MIDEGYEPKVSVIVPVYNSEKYIVDCLESIMVQSYENIEIICVDDDSQDDSIKIVTSYQQRDKRFITVRQPCNLGLSAARNKGLDLASGKYVIFVDSDDYISRDLIKKTVYMAEEKKLDEVIFDYHIITKKRDWELKYKLDKKQKNKAINYEVRTGLEMLVENETERATRATRAAWAALYNRAFLKKNNLRFYDGILHEDVLFYFKRCMCAERVVRIPDMLYYYRKRDNTITTSHRGTRAKSLLTIISEIYAVWMVHNFANDVNRAVESLMTTLWVLYNKAVFNGETEAELTSSNPAVDFMYHLQNNVDYVYGKLVNDDDVLMLRSRKRFVLFGCGSLATKVLLYLRQFDLSPTEIFVSSPDGNPRVFGGINVGIIDEIEFEKDIPVVIGVTSPNSTEVIEKLQELGFNNIIYTQN